MADGFAFDRGSAVRIADAVRAVENTTRTPIERREPNPAGRQFQLFRRTDGQSPTDILSPTIRAVQVWDVPGYEYEALSNPCVAGQETDPPDVPENAPAFDVNAATLYNGVIFPDELFLGINIGDACYAVGSSHTAIVGTIIPSQMLRVDCNIEIPFGYLANPTSAPDGIELEGSVGLADWATPIRRYVLVAWECTEAIP
jgi:hypothetical protein